MPLEHIILNLKGYKITRIKEGPPYEIEVKYVETVECPHCKSENIRKKDKFIRSIRHADICSKKVILLLQSYKYRCKDCGRYFNQRFPGILPYKRHTEIFRREIFTQHRDGISQKSLSDRLKIGTATIERWYKDFLKLKVSTMSDYECPRVLGIDEHFFTRKKGYATTFCDLGKHRIYDVVLGRSEKALARYLKNLKGKERVKVVVIDLSETYRSIVKKYFPNAKIVTDRFHVIRLINQHFLNIWKEMDPIGRKNRGLLSLIRRKQENLKPEQKIRLYQYLKQFPALERIYFMKQKLHRLLSKKKQTAKECRKLIPKFIKMVQDLQDSQMYGLVKIGNTLNSWSEEVVRMWRFTKSNGITEGFHTKMEMISRRAYGFRNFENYRLRVKALCC